MCLFSFKITALKLLQLFLHYASWVRGYDVQREVRNTLQRQVIHNVYVCIIIQ